MMIQVWQVNSCVERDSRAMPGTRCWHITLTEINSRTKVQTYVEETYNNYSNWHEIIQKFPRGLLIENIKLVNPKTANADSEPAILFDVEAVELEQMLQHHWGTS
jgi:hypothetical protein